MILEIITSVLVVVGGAFTLLGSIGLARLPDFFSRLHGPTKATTLGVGGVVIASLVDIGTYDTGTGARELAITLFLFITAPVSAHLLSKAALREQERRAAADAMPGSGDESSSPRP